MLSVVAFIALNKKARPPSRLKGASLAYCRRWCQLGRCNNQWQPKEAEDFISTEPQGDNHDKRNHDKRNHDKQPQQAGKRYIRSDDLTTPLQKEQMNEPLHDSPSHEAARPETRD